MSTSSAAKRAYNRTPEQAKRRREWLKAWTKTPEGKEYRRYVDLKHSTGWTRAQETAALAAQNGACAVCPRELDAKMNHDHCHATKRPRGLLCRACNLSLGYYEKWQRPAGLVLEPYEVYLRQHADEA